jgi:hypothetical protein
MAQGDFIDWQGQSGTVYRYVFVDILQPILAIAANYAFVIKLANGKFLPLYFGETDDAKRRLANHERWNEALRLGMTHVMAHSTQGGEAVRCREESDLIAFWQPALNVQHRQAR